MPQLQLKKEHDNHAVLEKVMQKIMEQYENTGPAIHKTNLLIGNLTFYGNNIVDDITLEVILLAMLHAIKPESIDENAFIKSLAVNLVPGIDGFEPVAEGEDEAVSKYNQLMAYIKKAYDMLNYAMRETADPGEESGQLLRLARIGISIPPRPGAIFNKVFNDTASKYPFPEDGSFDANIYTEVREKLLSLTKDDIVTMCGKELCVFNNETIFLTLEVLSHMKQHEDAVKNLLKWINEISGDPGLAENSLDILSAQDFSMLAYGINYLPSVKLMQASSIGIADLAVSKSRDKDSVYKTGFINKKRLNAVINVEHHESVAEHIFFSFDIKNISRALLQELSRHRMGSYTIKSSRYTLGELKDVTPFDLSNEVYPESIMRASKYLRVSTIKSINRKNMDTLNFLIQEKQLGDIVNDELKYALPESYLTEGLMTINLRSLRNFLSLRTDKTALKEMRLLAASIYTALPPEYMLFVSESSKL